MLSPYRYDSDRTAPEEGTTRAIEASPRRVLLERKPQGANRGITRIAALLTHKLTTVKGHDPAEHNEECPKVEQEA